MWNSSQSLWSRRAALIAGLGVILLLAPGTSRAQGDTPPDFGDLPDWSGVWQMIGGTVFDQATREGEGGSTTPGVREHPPYNAEWEAMYREHLALRDQQRFPDVISNCGVPAGWPRIFNLPDVYEMVVRPEQTWILSENGPNVYRIYTDGRDMPAPEDRWPTYTGVSVGRWEGRTLVWETKSTKGWMDRDVLLDRTGLVLSNQAEGTHRMYVNDAGNLQIDMVITDPQALTGPWPVTHQFRRLPPGTMVYDYGCAENNRNPVDTEQGVTLTLDPDGNPFPLD